MTKAASVAVAMASGIGAAASQGVIRDTEIESFIRRESDPIFRAAGVTPSSVDIYIINDPSLNAFAAAGPIMGLHTGLILAAETPNEVIGVIAHETGHIAGGHSVRTAEAAGKAFTPILLGLLLGAAAAVAGAPEAAIAGLGLGQQAAQDQFLTYSRAQEASADQAGLSFLEATGQSAEGLIAFFERFRYQEAISQARRFEYFRSHPLSSDRIAFATQRAKSSPYFGKPDDPELQFEFEMIQAKIRGFLEPPQYTFRNYRVSDHSLPAKYARAIATYRSADTETAIAQIDALIAEAPDNPFFHELKGQALLESGYAAEAAQAHLRAVELMPEAPLLHVNAAQALLSTEKREDAIEAKTHLDAALRHDRENPSAWRLAADYHAKMGETAMAELATAEQYFSLRQLEPARRFALRAKPGLERGSPAWRRATDIIIAGLSDREIDAINQGPGQ